MKITNKSFYERYKNFSGSFFEWFRACVNESARAEIRRLERRRRRERNGRV